MANAARSSLLQLHTVPPCKGRLRALRTRAEAQSSLRLVDVYVIQIPAKAANTIVKKIDQHLPAPGLEGLQHLRRFVKSEYLPESLKPRFLAATGPKPETAPVADKLERNGMESEACIEQCHERPLSPNLHFVAGSVTAISRDVVVDILSQSNLATSIHTASVPAMPPASEGDARTWSKHYWPTFYQKHNPHGPHPSMVARAENTIRPFADQWLSLALHVGGTGQGLKLGEDVGAVVVKTPANNMSEPEAVAVAADARFFGAKPATALTGGGVMNHAVMRAVGLVARKRLSMLAGTTELPRTDVVIDYPLIPLEEDVFASGTLEPGGYLCTGLDLYLTHEPCVMCSMAILHSRFDKVVFCKRMPNTGAVNPEPKSANNGGLGYGMFWRPELNWKLLAWEWLDDASGPDNLGDPRGIHA